MIEQGTSPKAPAQNSQSSQQKAKPGFTNFSQRDVDMAELERAMFNKNN
jgi:hypothetical protein